MTIHVGRKVALVLMKSDEADATIDMLERERPDVEVTDKGTYCTSPQTTRSSCRWTRSARSSDDRSSSASGSS